MQTLSVSILIEPTPGGFQACETGSPLGSKEKEGTIGPTAGNIVIGLEEIQISNGAEVGVPGGEKVGRMEVGIGSEVGLSGGEKHHGNTGYEIPKLNSLVCGSKKNETEPTSKVYYRRHKNTEFRKLGMNNYKDSEIGEENCL